ncbi:glycosyltransferase family 2 protein [Alkalinema pantanalense CENA528]|uniref:glycosyltransferase family 2 protein n=1 Tax=Alkalinema pantanalense TaxID=1620705 RepID=UPI003D6FBDE9
MAPMPKITVCIPTFNRAHLLPFAIGSVLAQTESDWELIVCDDGSTDDTPAVMAGYTDPRIRYLRHDRNIGKSNNMRSGYEAATGEYFIKFDDDDRLTPDFLAKTSQILDQQPEIGFVGTDHWVIDEQNQRRQDWSDQNSQRWGRSSLPEGSISDLLTVVFVRQSLQIGATLFRRSALQVVDYMRRDWQNCEDNDLFVRLALAGYSAYYLPERLMEYRFHPEQQGIHRAIPYLSDKVQYLQSYEFQGELEEIRRSRLAETQLQLGWYLIETGEIAKGRNLVQASLARSSVRSNLRAVVRSNTKAMVGLTLSYLPQPVRKSLVNTLRRAK